MFRGLARRELVRAFGVAGTATVLLLVGTWLLVRYQENKQLELAGFATAKAVAEQIATQRQIYAKEIVPRAKRAGMAVDTEFDQNDNALPVPVALVNRAGERLAKRVPGSRIRLYSRLPFTFRAPATLDAFEEEALDNVARSPERAFSRLDELDGKRVIRYALADVMEPDCVQCHNQHPQSPRHDWKVGDVRGAIEVVLPIDELAAEIRASEISGLLLLIGVGLGGLAIAMFLRHDLRRLRREQVALTDPITRLPTRQAVLSRIADAVARTRRARKPVSVVVFDVDRFKQINDTHGHAMGDRVLAGIGEALVKGVRQVDIAARWGGEEFLAIFPAVHEAEAREIAERIRASMSALAPETIAVTVSAGVAEVSADETPQAAIARADARLYEAKQAGRNAVR